MTKAALRVGLEAKLAQWSAEGAKAPDVFDLKLLRDMAALDEGGATQRVEITHTIMNPNTSATLRLLEAGSVTMSTGLVGNTQEALEMGLESQKVHALAESTEETPGPDVVGESEESLPDT